MPTQFEHNKKPQPPPMVSEQHGFYVRFRENTNESRQSDVCRRVIEDFTGKYSKIDKRSGSINPRR